MWMKILVLLLHDFDFMAEGKNHGRNFKLQIGQ
jgi:hypothetical protein